MIGTSPVDRDQVSPNATASSLASEPSYPMTTWLAILRFYQATPGVRSGASR